MTLHPALHRGQIPMRDATVNEGTLCPMSTVGKPGILMCSKPFDQPRDAARREECLDLDEKSLTTFMELWKGEKDLLGSTKMNFMRLRMNYSKQCFWWRFLQRVSIGPNIFVGV